MCDVNAFLLENGTEERVLEAVDVVEVDGDEIRLVNIFGEERILHARFKEMRNSEGKLTFEAL